MARYPIIQNFISQAKNAFRFISTIHDNLERGRLFTVGHVFLAVADGNSAYVLIRTDSGESADFSFSVAAGGNSLIYFYENANTSADGTELTFLNRKRDGSAPAGVSVFHTPTVDTDPGDIIEESVLPGGDKKSSGVIAGAEFEWVLSGGSDYLIEVVNKSGGAVDISVGVNYYIDD